MIYIPLVNHNASGVTTSKAYLLPIPQNDS